MFLFSGKQVPNARQGDTGNPPIKAAFSLLSIIVLMGVVMVLGVSLVNFVMNVNRITGHYTRSIMATNLAEAGLSKAIFCLNATDGEDCDGAYGPSYTGEGPIRLAEGTYTVTVSGSGNSRTATSVGTHDGGGSETLRLEVEKIPEDYLDTQMDFSIMADSQLVLTNNSEISGGPIYANVDVVCANNTAINSDVFVSKVDGLIDNCTLGGDAHADRLIDVTADGDCYWRTELDSTDCAGATYADQPTPEQKNLPYFDSPYWQNEAAAGGTINGDYEALEGDVLGPKKIDGDLQLDENADITMNGPIWVTGTIVMNNNSTIALDPSFGDHSSVIVADGTILIDPNAELLGSGQPDSYILVASNSTDPQAIHLKNNASGAIFLALNGGVDIDNGGGAAAVAAPIIDIKNTATIDYNESIGNGNLNLKTTTGGAGQWTAKDDSWRQIQ